MKAAICTTYGPPDVLQIQDVTKPTPRKNEVLVKIHATTVTASDGIVRRFEIPSGGPALQRRILQTMMGLVLGFGKPRKPILGMICAGEIEATGPDVTLFKTGDRVLAFTGTRVGCYAQYVCVPEREGFTLPPNVPSIIGPMPANLDYAEAAAIPYGGLMALHFIQHGHLQRGEQALIYGASGAIGTAAVQIAANHVGAEVTGVCSGRNVDLVRSLGAAHVIDYTQQDTLPPGTAFDFVLDAVGRAKSSPLKQQAEKALTPNGRAFSVDDGSPKYTEANLHLLVQMIEAGHVKPAIDRTYPLDEIVEAHRYVDGGHKRGSVVITVAH